MWKSIYCLTALLALQLLPGIGIAQESHAEQREVGFPDLTFKISTPKKEYLLLEPIPIEMELTNNHDREIVGSVRMNFSQDFIRLIRHHNHARTEFRPLSYLLLTDCVVYVQTPKFIPKASVSEKQVLIYQLDAIFPEPGDYQVQLVLENRYPNSAKEMYVVSDKLNIRITQPQDNEAVAYSHYSDADLQDLIQHKMEYTDKEKLQVSMTKAVAFLQSFSGSVYYKWVKEYLIQHYEAWKATPYVTVEEKSMYEKLKASP